MCILNILQPSILDFQFSWPKKPPEPKAHRDGISSCTQNIIHRIFCSFQFGGKIAISMHENTKQNYYFFYQSNIQLLSEETHFSKQPSLLSSERENMEEKIHFLKYEMKEKASYLVIYALFEMHFMINRNLKSFFLSFDW